MLMNKSNKPNAYPFQKWVNFEVLPKLKNDGYYINNNIKDEQLKKLKDEIVQKETLIINQQKRMTDLEKQVEKYKSNPRKEKTYQAWLNGLIEGQREVRVGISVFKDKRKHKRIDILTPNLIFECKRAKNWQQAITQILYYKDLLIKDNFYNNQVTCVFLFDDTNETENEIPQIREFAKKFNIELFYYKNMAGYVDADELEDNDNDF